MASTPKKLFHRWIWQRLPQELRRRLLFGATAALAPRPTPSAIAKLPIIVVGALTTASGLGQSARLCHDALKAAGVPVYGIDLTTALMQAVDYPDFEFTDGRALQGPGTLILHVNSPLVPLALVHLGRKLVRNKRIVCCWAWELPEVPRDWQPGIPFVHEIWMPSTFAAQSVLPIAGTRPVRIVPYSVAHLGSRVDAKQRSLEHPFTVLTIFNMASSFARKNPLATLRAFQSAFGDDPSTRLIIKTTNASVFPTGLNLLKKAADADNIVIIDRTMSAEEIATLYESADVVMSLHRSEGFGLTLAEAMLRGLPVVSTDWSGNVDFVTSETGVPIPFRLIPAEDPQGTYHHPGMSWAEADIDAAAQALRQLRANPSLRSTLGLAAAQFGLRTWSDEAYIGKVRHYLGI
jgi:glycosyltransferase involved in cell wall biosynthesis